MGLFDKKKKGRDEFDSLVEEIDLGAPEAGGAGADAGETREADEAETVDLVSAPGRGAGRIPAARPDDPDGRRARPASATYGIEDAIALMRTLPSENIELVVQVVKHTLESAGIDIEHIIGDATAKQQRTEARIKVLRDEIGELEREIDARRAEIAELDGENREISRVRERLILAEKLTQSTRPETVPEGQAPRAARASEPPPAARVRPTSTPPPAPPPGAGGNPSHTSSGSHAGGNPSHTSSGSHPIPTPAGPGGPVVGSSAVGPGGPAGTYSKQSATVKK